MPRRLIARHVPVRPRRPEPRRRDAPRWTSTEWTVANQILAARAGSCCECCGEPLGTYVERHHRKRRRDGGDRLSNVLLLNGLCHRWITHNPDAAKAAGLIVPVHADPETTPVLWRGGEWSLLDDYGNRRQHLEDSPA